MSIIDGVTHLVTNWHVWVSNQLDVKVPALCGVTSRDWHVKTPDGDHEISGSAPARMCTWCLEISDVKAGARAERQAETDSPSATHIQEAVL